MRFIVLFLFIFLPFFAVGQSVDTAAVNQQVDSLLKISNSLIEKGEFDKALEVNFVAEQFTLEKLGRGSMAYGNVCLKKGVIFYNQGNYPEAERWYLETKRIFEKKLGKWHRGYAAIVNNLGNLYFAEGNYQKAEKFYLETLAIDEKAVGKEHPNYAGSLLNIGTIYYSTSNYEKAEPYFLDAKKIWERSLGREHPRYVTALSNLGVLYMQWGDYLKAEPLFLEARDILKKITGEEHHYYAKVLSNLGNLYRAVGNYEKAVSCFLEAKNTREQVLGKEHPEYALALSKLGVSYSLLGNYEKAEPLLLEARGLTAKVLGLEAPQYSLILVNLGVFYLKYGDLEKASLILLEAKDLVEQNLGKGHDLYSNILVNLGTLNQRTDNYEQAESFFSEAETSWKEVIGEDDTYVKILKAQANLYWAIGKFEKVGPLYWEANEAEQKFLINASLHLSETELSSYIKTFNQSQNQIFSFSQLLQLGGSGLYDNTLFKKGFLLNSTNRINRLALSDSTSTELYYNHKSHLRRLAAEYAKPMAERQNVKELEAKAEELEKELVRTVAGYGEAIRQVSWQEVQVALQPGEAAVEFVHYTYSGPEPTDSVMYAALVLRPGDEAPHFIPLFEERQLQAQLQENLSDRKAYLNELYGHRKKKADSPSLYRLIWHPLEKLLANVETVYASPSGLLHRINLGAVMVDKRKTWGNKHQLVLLGSTRQLVSPLRPSGNSPGRLRQEASAFEGGGGNPDVSSRSPSAPPLTATLYGGIRYDMDSTAILRANQGEQLIASTGGELSFNYLERSIPERGLSWDELPGTKKEAEEIAVIIKKEKGAAEALQGYYATEESFKRLGKDGPSPRILHIATHGYFYPDPSSNEAANSPSFGEGWGEAIPFKASEHPMIRSGLVMAGGNQAWRGKPVPEGLEDGILTAYEVSQVDLRNTELVVLSACDTGLGDIEGNEGVYGLQRAFRIAGADKLIMSLWNVPDAQTQEMMVLFYKFWLEEGMELCEAFRAAQGEMRKKYKEHFYWAAFVLVE